MVVEDNVRITERFLTTAIANERSVDKVFRMIHDDRLELKIED